MANETRIVRDTCNLGAFVGPLWFGAWLFTIGFLHMQMPNLLFAIVIWPYYLGAALGHH